MLKTVFTFLRQQRRAPACRFVLLALAVGAGCGDSSSPTTPAPAPAPAPVTPTPTTPTPPTPEPTPAEPETATYGLASERILGPGSPLPLPMGVSLSDQLVLIRHARDWSLFEDGQRASDAMKALAETGDVSAVITEAEAAEAVIVWRSLRDLLGAVLAPDPSIEVTSDKPCFSLAEKLTPSSDWFIGFASACATDEDGNWLDLITVENTAWDAGTAAGPPFAEKTSDTEPREPIEQLNLRDHWDGLDTSPAVFHRYTITRKTQ